MIIVSVAFVVCWFPSSIFFLILPSLMQTYDPVSLAIGGYMTVFLAYLNSCLNPFIYATKHEGVKRQLARLVMVCRRAPAVGDEPGTIIPCTSSRAAAATGQTRSTLAHR